VCLSIEDSGKPTNHLSHNIESLSYEPQYLFYPQYRVSTMTSFSNRLSENHSLSDWEVLEEDDWTTRFRSNNQYQVEVFFRGGESGNEWVVSLLEKQKSGTLTSIDSREAIGIDNAVKYADEYGSKPQSFI